MHIARPLYLLRQIPHVQSGLCQSAAQPGPYLTELRTKSQSMLYNMLPEPTCLSIEELLHCRGLLNELILILP